MALARRSELFLSYFLLSLHTVNMTLSTSLIANGRQLGCLESVKTHCLLCPVKLNTDFCTVIACNAIHSKLHYSARICFRSNRNSITIADFFNVMQVKHLSLRGFSALTSMYLFS